MTSVVESMNVNEATTDDGDNESDERGTALPPPSAPLRMYFLPSRLREGRGRQSGLSWGGRMGATATDAWMGRRPRIGDAITRKTGEDFLSSSHGWRWNLQLGK